MNLFQLHKLHKVRRDKGNLSIQLAVFMKFCNVENFYDLSIIPSPHANHKTFDVIKRKRTVF